MPPKKKPDVAASKPVSPTRTQASGERRAAAATQKVPPPPPPEKVVPDGAGGNIRSGEDAAAQGNFTRPHPSRSGGEKSIDGNAGRDPTVGVEKRQRPCR